MSLQCVEFGMPKPIQRTVFIKHIITSSDMSIYHIYLHIHIEVFSGNKIFGSHQ
jgi:hypothetical protein